MYQGFSDLYLGARPEPKPKSYWKSEVIQMAHDVLGIDVDPQAKYIPLPVLEKLGLCREYNYYVEVG